MKKPVHMPSLDGLRGLAAIMVVLTHVIELHPGLGIPISPQIGSGAVALFFTLSGFLMMVLYGHQPFSAEGAASFLVNRFARIYPAYLLAVCLTIPLSLYPALEYPVAFTGTPDIFRHLALAGSKGVFWTVPPEIQFYLLFPLLWYGFSKCQRSILFVYVLAGTVAILGLLDFPGPGIFIASKLHFFLAGALAGHVHTQAPDHTAHPLHGLLALGLCGFLFAQQAYATSSRWDLEMALLATVVVAAAAREHSWSAAVLASPPLRWAGRVSFSLYLHHLLIFWLATSLFRGTMPESAEAIVSVVLSGLMAEMINRLAELPARSSINGWWRVSAKPLLVRLLAQANPGIGRLRWTSR